jgi:hypothetical protein
MTQENMQITPLFEAVDGSFNMSTEKLECVPYRKYNEVLLCFKSGGGSNIPFAKIKLHSRDRAIDAEASFDDATRLGNEIVKRWNTATET